MKGPEEKEEEEEHEGRQSLFPTGSSENVKLEMLDAAKDFKQGVYNHLKSLLEGKYKFAPK